MSTTTVRPDIAAFAADVRGHLDDLSPDDVDDLLDGLEADMSDQAAEAGEAFEIPDAAAYAAELRAAAGLPPRTANATKSRAPFRARLAAWVGRGRENPAVTGILEFLVALRPVWWLVRGVALWLLATRPLGARWIPEDPFSIACVLAFVLVSVQWGRGRWVPTQWLKATRTFLNVVAILAIPFLVFGIINYIDVARTSWSAIDNWEPWTPGLSVDGQRVRNIFAYDANGEPIEQVQLFDQNGEPLVTVGRDGAYQEWDPYFFGGGGPTPVAERVAGRDPVWNIFPLREVPPSVGYDELSSIVDEGTVPSPPFDEVPPIPSSATESTSTVAAEPSSTPLPTPIETPLP